MKVNGFGAWPSWNVSKGGRRYSFDEYNRALKGSERFPRAEEYAGRSFEEYHHYQEQQDLTGPQDDEKSKKDRKKKDSKNRRQRMVQQFVVLVAGSLLVASAYTAASANRARQNEDANASTVETEPDQGGNGGGGGQGASDASAAAEQKWEWSSDGEAATLIILDGEGNVLDEIPATVTSSEVPADCKTEGTLTYTANASWDGQDYSDSRDEVLPALGHAFDDGKEIILDDGSTAMEFTCSRCEEQFIIKNSLDEE